MEIVAIGLCVILGLLGIVVCFLLGQCVASEFEQRKRDKNMWAQPKNDPDFTWTDDDGNERRIQVYKRGFAYWVWKWEVNRFNSWDSVRYSDTRSPIEGRRTTRRRAIKAALAMIPVTVKESETGIVKDR